MAATVQQREYIRQDGKEKVTGAGRYTADLTLAGQLHAAFRYSDHTRARILRIDASRARALPGVFAVLTHEDVPDVLYGQLVKDRRLFAKDEVRFEADIIAAVAALTPALAKEAVGLIDVEYEQLPPVTDPEAALAPDAPLVHADWASYEAEEALGLNGNVLGYGFWSTGNFASLTSTARYLMVDGVDPLFSSYAGGFLPSCVAPCPGIVTFTNVLNGSYPAWNVLTFTTAKPVPPGVQALINDLQSFVVNTVPDFVPITSMNVFRSHYNQSGKVGSNGYKANNPEAGGSVQGAVFTVQSDLDEITDTGKEIIGFKN